MISWGALLVLSAPLAILFAALGVRMPVSGGVAEYVRVGFGPEAGVVTGGWFLTAVLIGAPTVAMIGGLYVADLTGSGTVLAPLVALAIFATVLLTNALGLRISAKVQLVLAGILTLMIAVAVGTALPSSRSANWTPFAPHGWLAIGTAGNILIWLFVGWESVAQLTGEFRDPGKQLPRAMALAFAAITVLYCGLAIVTVGVATQRHSNVPLADLMAVGMGEAGRRATTILAVALTMATMNVYIASAARLASALSVSGALPRWLGVDRHLSVPRRPLLIIGVLGAALLLTLAFHVANTTLLVRATAACFVAVYVAATAASVRILSGLIRFAAIPTTVLVGLIAIFSSWYLIVPLLSGVCFVVIRRRIVPSASADDNPAGPSEDVQALAASAVPSRTLR